MTTMLDISDAKERIPEKKHFHVIQRTYQANTHSDYTEKIADLGSNFDYKSNSDRYWGDQELSTFYGTPFYQETSLSQKLALNHLYWVGQYAHTANSEANTMLYNQVTSGVFTNISGYDTLCRELAFETDQERYHIKTFQKIGYQTKLALLGKESLGNPWHKKLHHSMGEKLLHHIVQPFGKRANFINPGSSLQALQEYSLRAVTKMIFYSDRNNYSQFLQEKGNLAIPTTTGGLAGITGSPTLFKFLTLNWGSSPFLAAQYYSTRMIANMSLKTYEHPYFKLFKDLERKGEAIPVPTAVSYYHLLDESFHTTMSQVISQDVYKDFPKPSLYEKFLANAIIYLAQRGILGGLSGVLPAVFREDACFMHSFYRLLKSPLFNLSDKDALYWMEKCLCQEHEGFHVNLKYHQSLLSNFCRFFEKLDYLWAVNRELHLMAAGGSIERAIERNTAAFKQFSRSVSL
jgi:hypothetical protein